MKTALLHEYKTRADRYLSHSALKSKELKILSFFRFIAFVSIVPVTYYLYPLAALPAFSTAIVLLGLFLFLVKKYIQTEQQLQFYQNLATINQNEISALNRNFQGFDPGNEFIDPHHDYSFDLDLYGTGSLFQYLNRTVTDKGKKHLAELLNRTQRSSDEMRQRQSAIQELAESIDWRQRFLASKNSIDNSITQAQTDLAIQIQTPLKKAKTLKYLTLVLPPVTLLLIILRVAGLDPFSTYRIAILTQWILLVTHVKTLLKFHNQFESQGKILNQYSEMLGQIESLQVKNEYLNKLRKHLQHRGKTASQITSELSKLLKQFDYSKNVVIGFILDSVFMWDIKCISKLNEWQQNYSSFLPHWFAVIAEFDALISLANFNYNHPEWTTPQISERKFCLNAVDAGHPLIDENRCVRNTFHLNNEEQIAIITGANMAGKSTFLRTIGINLILASNGCKVFARTFDFSPVAVFTNMRTTDNLMNDESYFYAELLRLQTMLNRLKAGENLFIIIDEMLKGTNSIDKLNGSKELIKQLILLNTHGIVATHDLGLTELAENFHSVKNKCFEVDLSDKELSFNYKLTDGVTQTMNATFLMKKMGIIPTQK